MRALSLAEPGCDSAEENSVLADSAGEKRGHASSVLDF